MPLLQTELPLLQTELPLLQTELPLLQTELPLLQTELPKPPAICRRLRPLVGLRPQDSQRNRDCDRNPIQDFRSARKC
ncbi:hypothetical protein EDC14_100243 [Hydrogenispora ethanolica]|uniref:Uncharacterized protein n=1 Tax=Hydrogenispora ethanolica TaxID=1082276 RepID=A0A4R1SBB6_HYDET|nr:hypothetical protein [Hydrogenispora ethanolica]TCL76290.1 hypothetical protein EDC14_100243 [Hydrogenispora ethanolica]